MRRNGDKIMTAEYFVRWADKSAIHFSDSKYNVVCCEGYKYYKACIEVIEEIFIHSMV